LEAIRAFVKKNLSRLPKALREPYSKYKYPVLISPKLKKLRHSLAKQLKKRQ